MKSCSIIDAPSDLGLRARGVRGLPDALRAAGLLEGLPDVRCAGHVPLPTYVPARDHSSGVLNVEGLTGFMTRLAERVAFSLDLRRFPLVLGGDCSILLGPALALRKRGRFGLFFLDGHADYYSPETEPHGEAASMDLALVNGYGPDVLTDVDGCRPLIREEDTVVLGYRDAESAAEYGSPDIRETQVHACDLTELRRVGAEAAAREGLRVLEGKPIEGFWVHVDADVLNDEVMPAVDYRIRDGLWPEELTAALTVILASPLAMGMELTIYNPSLDDAERSAARILAKSVTTAFAMAT